MLSELATKLHQACAKSTSSFLLLKV